MLASCITHFLSNENEIQLNSIALFPSSSPFILSAATLGFSPFLVLHIFQASVDEVLWDTFFVLLNKKDLFVARVKARVSCESVYFYNVNLIKVESASFVLWPWRWKVMAWAIIHSALYSSHPRLLSLLLTIPIYLPSLSLSLSLSLWWLLHFENFNFMSDNWISLHL